MEDPPISVDLTSKSFSQEGVVKRLAFSLSAPTNKNQNENYILKVKSLKVHQIYKGVFLMQNAQRLSLLIILLKEQPKPLKTTLLKCCSYLFMFSLCRFEVAYIYKLTEIPIHLLCSCAMQPHSVQWDLHWRTF